MSTLRTLDEVAAAIPPGDRVIIGIAGPPGAGKSTIAQALMEKLPDAALLPMDGFHLPQAELRRLGRRERMGAPDTFDVDGFIAVLEALRRGETVTAPGFDRELEEPVSAPARLTCPTAAQRAVTSPPAGTGRSRRECARTGARK